MLKGYDLFFRDPGTVDEIRCRVCGSKCDVKTKRVRADMLCRSRGRIG